MEISKMHNGVLIIAMAIAGGVDLLSGRCITWMFSKNCQVIEDDPNAEDADTTPETADARKLLQ